MMRILSLCLLLVCTTYATAATIQTQVDSTHIVADGEVRLRIYVQDTKPIDTDAISGITQLERQFHIIAQATSESHTIINGKVTHAIQIDMRLLAKDAQQTLTIPSFSYQSAFSEPITLSPAPNKPTTRTPYRVEFTVAVDKEEIFVGQPIVYKAQIKTDVDLLQATLTDIGVTDGVVKSLPQQTELITTSEWQYRLYTAPALLFPTQAGTFTVAPRRLRADVELFNNYGQFMRTRTIHRMTDALHVVVNPPPNIYFNKQGVAVDLPYWLPADALTMTENWDIKNTPQQGDIISRTIRVVIDNSLPAYLPRSLIAYQAPTGATVYEDAAAVEEREQPRWQLVWQQTVRYLLQKEGTLVIPAESIVWWNNQTNRFETTSSATKTLEVLLAKTPNTNSPNTNTPHTTTNSQQNQTDVNKDTIDAPSNTKNQILADTWLLFITVALIASAVVVVVIIGLVLMPLLVRKHKKHLLAQQAYARKKAHILALLENTDLARKDQLQQIAHALLAWSKEHWQAHNTNLTDWQQTACARSHTKWHAQIHTLVSTLRSVYEKSDDTQDAKTIDTKQFGLLLEALLTPTQSHTLFRLRKMFKRKQTKATQQPLPSLYPHSSMQPSRGSKGE